MKRGFSAAIAATAATAKVAAALALAALLLGSCASSPPPPRGEGPAGAPLVAAEGRQGPSPGVAGAGGAEVAEAPSPKPAAPAVAILPPSPPRPESSTPSSVPPPLATPSPGFGARALASLVLEPIGRGGGRTRLALWPREGRGMTALVLVFPGLARDETERTAGRAALGLALIADDLASRSRGLDPTGRGLAFGLLAPSRADLGILIEGPGDLLASSLGSLFTALASPYFLAADPPEAVFQALLLDLRRKLREAELGRDRAGSGPFGSEASLRSLDTSLVRSFWLARGRSIVPYVAGAGGFGGEAVAALREGLASLAAAKGAAGLASEAAPGPDAVGAAPDSRAVMGAGDRGIAAEAGGKLEGLETLARLFEGSSPLSLVLAMAEDLRSGGDGAGPFRRTAALEAGLPRSPGP